MKANINTTDSLKTAPNTDERAIDAFINAATEWNFDNVADDIQYSFEDELPYRASGDVEKSDINYSIAFCNQ